MPENNEIKIADEIMDLMPSDDNSKSIIKTLLENQIKYERENPNRETDMILKYPLLGLEIDLNRFMNTKS